MARRRVFQRAAVRRRTTWEGTGISVSVTSGTSVVTTLLSEAALENIPNPTIVRIRGSLLLRVTAQGASASTAHMFMGIKLTTATALAIPAVELPDADIGSDWIWWGERGFSTLDTGIGQSNSGQTYERLIIDSKAMRKVQPNQVLVLVTQNVVTLSTQTILAEGAFRILLKL